jgi:hypothetical protein
VRRSSFRLDLLQHLPRPHAQRRLAPQLGAAGNEVEHTISSAVNASNIRGVGTRNGIEEIGGFTVPGNLLTGTLCIPVVRGASSWRCFTNMSVKSVDSSPGV